MDPRTLEVGELLSDVFLVADAKLLVDRRGQNYYSLILNYNGGQQIEGKVWADNIGARIEAGRGIEVLARIDQYIGQPQLNIQRYRILSPDEFDVSRFVRATTIDTDAAFETLFNWEREEFKDARFKRLMGEFYSNSAFAQEFKTSPAASFHHHNYRGGLIEHTLDMWMLADKLCEHYAGRFNRELVLCAAAVHDVGKVKCYTMTSAVSEHTDLGYLLNHVFISASMVSNVWDRVAEKDDEKAARQKALLLHIILSHHGRRDWGSPVVPQTPEAVLINHCDQVSASMKSCFDAVEQRPQGQDWTDKIYIMDEPRRLFVPPT